MGEGDNDEVSHALEASIHEWIAMHGTMPFEQFVERALYDSDHGFYATVGQAGGRRGDFVTSVEVGPLFAALIADRLDRAWLDAGRPSEFFVSEVGAGVGTLFRGVLRAAPACLDSLTYTLVERSAHLQAQHESLPTDSWRSSPTIPTTRQHVVMANELLDNLAFGIAERVDGGWAPVHVGSRNGELLLDARPKDQELDYLTDLAPDATAGQRVPITAAANEWVVQAKANADLVVVFDYAASTAELAARSPGWLRTYAAHTKGSDPLVAIGTRDITCDVAIDQLPWPDVITNQADWLGAQGLEERVEAARALWSERGHIGDLAAIAARSAIGEAQALTDPDGLGAFIVLEWDDTLAQR